MPSSESSLLDHVPDDTSPDTLLFAFVEWVEGGGLELYPHQEEAIISIFGGDNVVLATPTGSGKSMVALAGAFAMVAQGKRAVYTAPIKALVSEKFFEIKGLTNVVISSYFKTKNSIFSKMSSSEHNNGQMHALMSNLFTQIKTITIGQG